MAVPSTSGTYSYSATVINLLTASLRLCQIIGDTETPTGEQLQNAFDAFSLLVQSLQATNSHVWLQEDVTLFLQPGQYVYCLGVGSADHFAPTLTVVQTTTSTTASSGASAIAVASAAGIAATYSVGVQLVSGSFFWTTVSSVSGTTVNLAATLPGNVASGAVVNAFPTSAPRPLKVSGARRYVYSTGQEIPLLPMSRLDFYNLSNKNETGSVAQYFYDPQTGFNSYSNLVGIMSVNPAPVDDAVAVRFTSQRPIQDLGSLASLVDFPAEWNALLKWMLAYEIGPEYGCPTEQLAIIKDQITAKAPVLAAWDKEAEGTTVYPFTQTVYQLIAGALRLCGGSAPQDVPTLGQVENGLLTLNAMVQAWQASGMHVWTQETLTVTQVVGQASYQIGPSAPDLNAARPLRVTGARLIVTSTGESVPLIPMSRLDYANLSGKVTPTGQPRQFFYDPQIPLGTLYLYPAPADTLSTVNLTAQRPLTTFANLSSTADFPDEWLSPLRFNLAVELAPEYKCPPEQYTLLKKVADEKFQMVTAWDVEQQGTTAFPFGGSIYQIISRALRLCGAIGPQDTASYGLAQNAFSALQSLVLQLQASGIHLWCEEEIILFPQPNQTLYFIGPNTTDHATTWDDFTQTALAENALTSATSVVVVSASDIAVADHIGIQLDAGTNFWTTVASVAGTAVGITDPMPSTATAPAAVFVYTTPLTRPLRLYGYRRYSVQANPASRFDVPMTIWARLDYQAQPNKYTPGVMTAAFYDPQTGGGVYGQEASQLNLWPSPSDYTYVFRATGQRPLNQPTSLEDPNLDFPVEWQNALIYCLAVDLWPEYGGNYGSIMNQPADGNERSLSFPVLRALANEKLQSAQSWDTEPESILFGVAMQPGYRTR